MEMSTYVERLRSDLVSAAAPGGAEVQRAAELLGAALGPSVRLVLLDLLADAGAEIGGLVGADVGVRLVAGGRVELTAARAPDPEPLPVDPTGELARLTLRLPQQLKAAAEHTAAGLGQSVNAFLTTAVQRAVDRALDDTSGRPSPSATSSRSRVTGWARS
jgi:hypothetical protein